MAALVASVPLPLLLHSLLLSSWTWLALSLATIATLLRALRPSLSRHRPQALLPPPSSVCSAEIPSFISEVSSFSHPLQKAHKRRVSSKSTPALQELFANADGLACPGSGFFSCLRDRNFAPACLRKIASDSTIFDRHGRRDCSEGASRLHPGTIDCKSRLGLRLGFLVDTQREGSETPTHGLIKEDVNPYQMWTSDMLSACKPLQNTLFEISSSSSGALPCFETQFGWHTLLDWRLGSPWRDHTSLLTPASVQVSMPAIHNGHVVKVWSVHQRNLYTALRVEETSVVALDVNTADAFACIACRNGKISQWDIANQACLSRVSFNVTSSFTLCLNAEKGVAIAGNGNGNGFGLWDFKSPSLIPIVDGRKRPLNLFSCRALQCKGDTLCIDQGNGLFSLCDLRKPQGGCLPLGTIPDALQVSSKVVEEEESLVLWEKLVCDDEEFWDEPLMGCEDAFQKSSSFTSRCVAFVRSLSSSGRETA